MERLHKLLATFVFDAAQSLHCICKRSLVAYRKFTVKLDAIYAFALKFRFLLSFMILWPKCAPAT